MIATKKLRELKRYFNTKNIEKKKKKENVIVVYSFASPKLSQ